jgi:hypothetical protein
MVRDDPKLSYDTEEVFKPNGVVGSPIPSREIVSLLDGKLTRSKVPPVFRKRKRKRKRSNRFTPSFMNNAFIYKTLKNPQ